MFKKCECKFCVINSKIADVDSECQRLQNDLKWRIKGHRRECIMGSVMVETISKDAQSLMTKLFSKNVELGALLRELESYVLEGEEPHTKMYQAQSLIQ